ncbi:MAG: response regulator transcription factor [Clostridiales bacterium]|nr:response regulator transcription factor [Clostridiales bacterium]
MADAYNVLIADDEREIISVLRMFLEKENIQVYEAYDGEMVAMVAANYPIDLAILDIMMPRMNGYDVLRRIRRESDIPVMILSAKVQLDDKVLGLELGADDYITKPFEPREVVARVKANLRRHARKENAASPVLTGGGMELDPACCTLRVNGRTVDLTRVELCMMELFLSQPGRVFTRDQLCRHAWEGGFVDDNTIRVAVSRLRDKIGNDRIKTIRGLGYRLEV